MTVSRPVTPNYEMVNIPPSPTGSHFSFISVGDTAKKVESLSPRERIDQFQKAITERRFEEGERLFQQIDLNTPLAPNLRGSLFFITEQHGCLSISRELYPTLSTDDLKRALTLALIKHMGTDTSQVPAIFLQILNHPNRDFAILEQLFEHAFCMPGILPHIRAVPESNQLPWGKLDRPLGIYFLLTTGE